MQRRPHLPGPSQAFAEKKTKILDRLAVPEAEYTDLSPKGTVDKGIRRLIDEINSTDGFVTTSSCAGRVSVFLEGRKAAAFSDADAGAGADEQPPAQVAGVGGKGAGGTWLYVSHDPVPGQDWLQTLALEDGEAQRTGRLIHFKFEPMVSERRPLLFVPGCPRITRAYVTCVKNNNRSSMFLRPRLPTRSCSCALRCRRALGNRAR